ncbi:E3 ubiquitin-protein ligase ARI5 [Phlyctema vagabunda]|uniref:RBR-type E3 ubiquitin transferase n=1 Tax=Phlyctema vagabunda TaxID=108571 RepID=A0ABR4PSV3_9HELO
MNSCMDFDNLANIDEETASLIIRLQIEDSEELDRTAKGKGREDQLTDAQLALAFYREELERTASVVSDRQMTRSIARACQTDGDVLSNSIYQEQAAANDRAVACRLGGAATPPHMEPWTVTAEQMDDELLRKLEQLYISPRTPSQDGGSGGGSTSSDSESSIWAASRSDTRTRQCVACQKKFRFTEVARVPCKHEYCRECLQDLFRASFSDESLFPPRCCRQTISAGGIRIFLTREIINLYEEKKIEFDTPNRTYCSNPACSRFLQANNIVGDVAACPDCAIRTCTMCKQGEHVGDCPADVGLQAVLQAADENGWQRCYSCRRIVELEIGCNHMTCHCGAQFCYICGERWKTCHCVQWNEDRLLERANQVVARRPRLRQQLQEDQVAAAVENLRTRHNCDHDRWNYVRGSHQCEECYHMLPSYIFECQQCHIQACNRCRRNRL